MHRKIVCIGNGPVMSYTPYMAKLANVLNERGLEVLFITWSREDDITTAVDPSNVEVKVLMRIGKKTDSKLKISFLYIFWMFKLFLYFIKCRESHFICSRFESCFPLFVVSAFKKIRYVYADRDPLHATYKWPFLIKNIIKKVEMMIAKRSVVHLIPGESRRYTNYENVFVIPNMPTSWAIEKAYLIYKNRNSPFCKEKLIVYINGWLVETRGKKHILNALNDSSISDFCHFIVAGDLDLDLRDVVELNSNVTYLGRLSNEEALSYYFDTDIVVSLYDPSFEINRKAEPNKWWDCVSTGTVFVTNYGIETVGFFKEYIGFYLIDYFNNRSLSEFLYSVRGNVSGMKRKGNSIINLDVSWDSNFNIVLDKLYGNKGF